MLLALVMRFTLTEPAHGLAIAQKYFDRLAARMQELGIKPDVTSNDLRGLLELVLGQP